MAVTQAQLATLYLAYFGKAAELDGGTGIVTVSSSELTRLVRASLASLSTQSVAGAVAHQLESVPPAALDYQRREGAQWKRERRQAGHRR